MAGRAERLLRVGVISLALLAIGLAAHRGLVAPEGAVILSNERAPWIMAATPVTAELQQWGQSEGPLTGFFRSFELSHPPATAALVVRSFGELELFVNDSPVALPTEPGANWRHFREIDVAGWLRPGENKLRAEVRNKRGPALLSLRLEGDGFEIASGNEWHADIRGGETVRALIASDVRRAPDAELGEAPATALAQLAPALAALALLGAGTFAMRWRGDQLDTSWLVWAVGLLVVALWTALFVTKFRGLARPVGFDSAMHLAYIELMAEGGSPLATEGWSTYHPPLFHWLCAQLQRLGASLPALRLLPFLTGLGNVAVAAALARRLAPGDRSIWLYATLFAAVLPMNLYIAAYLSNEGLHSLLSGCALFIAADLLMRDRLDAWRILALSTLLGLALLTKFTALVTVACAAGAVGLKIVLEPRARPTERVLRFAALTLPALLICGWFYTRNVMLFQALVGNWNLSGATRVWWSPPGFHTPTYYLSFGEALVRPYLSGFVSFWDALYSTLWGDGFIGGRTMLRFRHTGWNYTWMSAGYALALPVTLLLASGFARGVRLALVDPAAGRRASFALIALFCAATGFSIFYTTLWLPYVGQAKAFYGLATTPALSLFFALGLRSWDDWLARRGFTIVRAVSFAWLAMLAGSFYLSYAA